MPTWPQGISANTWPVVACGGTCIGLKGILHAAKVLAITGIEIMTGEDGREAARGLRAPHPGQTVDLATVTRAEASC